MAVKSTKEKKTATPKNGVVKAEKSSKTSSRKTMTTMKTMRMHLMKTMI
jgi:hypothetical protein